MLHAYKALENRLIKVPQADLSKALWIDLYLPKQAERDAVESLGQEIPDADQMVEIQPSSRLQKSPGHLSITVFLPGESSDGERSIAPVAFVIGRERLITVRDHILPTFERLPNQDCEQSEIPDTPGALMVEILEGITGDIADRLENAGLEFDRLADVVFDDRSLSAAELQDNLRKAAHMGERLSTLRHALLTVERALTFVQADDGEHADVPAGLLRAVIRDTKALATHCDYLSTRATALTDATLGMIDLTQSRSFAVLSSVTALFVPPTFIASFYGMNFVNMPELHTARGFHIVLMIMVISVLCAFVFLRWRRLL